MTNDRKLPGYPGTRPQLPRPLPPPRQTAPAETATPNPLLALADDIVTVLDRTPSRSVRVALLTKAIEGALRDSLFVVAALLEQAGGTVRLPKAALLRNRGEVLTTDEDKLIGEVVLTLERRTSDHS